MVTFTIGVIRVQLTNQPTNQPATANRTTFNDYFLVLTWRNKITKYDVDIHKMEYEYRV